MPESRSRLPAIAQPSSHRTEAVDGGTGKRHIRGQVDQELEELRDALDAVDSKLVDALVERRDLVKQVARWKVVRGRGIRDPQREQELLEKLVARGEAAGLDSHFVKRLFREIIDHSVRLQQEYFSTSGDPNGAPRRTIVVAFQGGEGAYSHLAATRHFGARDAKVIYEGFPSFKAMLEAVKNGMADYAVLPIENSIAGSINENYDLLAKMDLHLVGEELQRVEHCLIGLQEVPLTQIRRIFSHPVALAQCGAFLATLSNSHAEAYNDTALSVRRVKEEQDPTQAAIASEEAARVYGLPVLARNIADQKDNFTRMVMVATERVVYDAALHCKTSLILSTKHEGGALLKVLQTLANHGLNLTKLESRPQPDSPFEYVFYVDFEGNTSTPETQAALTELRECTSFLRVLGSYPASRPS